MRALALAAAIVLTPAAFAQSEPAWRTWMRQGERIVRTEGPKLGQALQKEAERRVGKLDLANTLNIVQELWRIRESILVDPEILLAACGADGNMIRWIRQQMGN